MNEFTLAEHILALVNQQGKNINNLKLNVIVPHIMDYAMQHNYQLKCDYQNDPCYVWRYGPIYPKLYQKYNSFGPTPIIRPGHIDPDWSPYNRIIFSWLKRRTFKIIDDNHQNSFWQRHQKYLYQNQSNTPYPINRLENQGMMIF